MREGIRVLLEFLRPYIPKPKVYVPALAGLGSAIAAWIVTGTFNREELALVFLTAWYATIGWATPEVKRPGLSLSVPVPGGFGEAAARLSKRISGPIGDDSPAADDQFKPVLLLMDHPSEYNKADLMASPLVIDREGFVFYRNGVKVPASKRKKATRAELNKAIPTFK